MLYLSCSFTYPRSTLSSVSSSRSRTGDSGSLSSVQDRVWCHKVLFSICLLHALLHQPLTCAAHSLHRGDCSSQSELSTKLTTLLPILRRGRGKWQFLDQSVESYLIKNGLMGLTCVPQSTILQCVNSFKYRLALNLIVLFWSFELKCS